MYTGFAFGLDAGEGSSRPWTLLLLSARISFKGSYSPFFRYETAGVTKKKMLLQIFEMNYIFVKVNLAHWAHWAPTMETHGGPHGVSWSPDGEKWGPLV